MNRGARKEKAPRFRGAFSIAQSLSLPATASTASATAASVTPAAAAARTAAAAALAFGFGLVDRNGPTLDLLEVESRDGRCAFGLIRHLDEAEPPRPARHLVHDDRDGRNLAMGFERLADIVLGRLIRQVAYVDVHHLLPKKIETILQRGRAIGAFVDVSQRAVEPNLPTGTPYRILELLAMGIDRRCSRGRTDVRRSRPQPPWRTADLPNSRLSFRL